MTLEDLDGERPVPAPGVLPTAPSMDRRIDPDTGEILGARSALMEPGEATEALGTGITQGLLETVPFGGAVAGGALGLKIGAATPIPGGAFIGGLAGTVGGYLAGQKAEEAGKTLLPMTRPQVEAYRQGGKTFGSSVAMLAPFSLATRTPKAGEVAVREVANRLPQNSVDWVKSVLEQPLAFLRQRPVAFTTTEVASGAGAGAGAALYEMERDPTEVSGWESGARLGAEVIGGVLGGFVPSVFINANLDTLRKLFGSAKSAVSDEGIERMTGEYLRQVADRSGQSPEEIRRLLSQPQPDIVVSGDRKGMTTAQLTGVPIFSALEKTLAKGNATANKNFSREIEVRGLNALQSYYKVLGDLTTNGSPEALALAAKMRAEQAKALVESRFELAHVRLADAVAQMQYKPPSNTPEGIETATRNYGEYMNTQVGDAITDLRNYEKEAYRLASLSLFEKTPTGKIKYRGGQAQPIQVEAPNTIRALFDLQTNAPDIALPGRFKRDVIDKLNITNLDLDQYRQAKLTREAINNNETVPLEMIYRVDPESGEVIPFESLSAKDLIEMRSGLLTDMRSAVANRDFSRAHFLDRLQQGIIADLQSLESPELRYALDFSRQFNDAFTRTFASDVVATGRSGAQRIAPELLQDRVFSRGRVGAKATELRVQQLEEAMDFGLQTARQRYASAAASMSENPTADQLANLQKLEENVLMAQGRVNTVTSANADILRMMANEAVDETGTLNAAKLNNFIQSYRPLLDRYGLTEDLSDATKAQQIVDGLRDPNSYFNQSARSTTALARVLSYESPIKAVEGVFNSKFPARDLRNIALMAKKGGPEAVDGLRTVMFDIAYNRAGGEGNLLNPEAYKDFFFKPIDRGLPSTFDILRKEGILTTEDGGRMRKVLDEATRIERIMDDETALIDLLKTGNMLSDFMVRVGGARAGALLSKIGLGGNIQTPGFGADLARSLFIKSPNALIRGTLEKAMLDPEYFSYLMTLPRNQMEKFQLKQRAHAYAAASGLNYATFDEQPPEEEPPLAPRGQRPTMFRPQPAAPATRGLPGMPPSGGQPGQPAPGPQSAAPPSQSRAMLQQLFPFDSISAMAAQQQQPPAPPPG